MIFLALAARLGGQVRHTLTLPPRPQLTELRALNKSRSLRQLPLQCVGKGGLRGGTARSTSVAEGKEWKGKESQRREGTLGRSFFKKHF